MHVLVLSQAKKLAEENNLHFDKEHFNFSHKWLLGFKKANNINRIRLHGEGQDADLRSVHVVRTQLPRILGEVPLSKIYNFDETGELLHNPVVTNASRS